MSLQVMACGGEMNFCLITRFSLKLILEKILKIKSKILKFNIEKNVEICYKTTINFIDKIEKL